MPKWTKEEEELLIENIDKVSKEELLKLFPNRTWKALQHKYGKLGFKFRDNYKPIAKDELFMNFNSIEHMKCKSCRRYLPFDYLYFPKDTQTKIGTRSICKECKGEKFNIKDIVWTNEESKIIESYYEDITNREIQKWFLPDKTMEQINHKGIALGLHKTDETMSKARKDGCTEEWRKKISETRIKNGLSKGERNSMYGTSRSLSENPNWQGGVSNLYRHLRRFIKDWKWASMKSSEFKCVLTGDRFDDIHHTYSFDSIVHDTLNNLNLPIKLYINEYSEKDLRLIENECMRIHMENIGVCLRSDIHLLFHRHFGFGNNTPEQFEEFKSMYLNNDIENKELLTT